MRHEPRERVTYIGSHGAFRGEDAGVKPVPSDMPGVKGIYVGGCVSRGLGNLSLKTSCPAAHAHNDPRDEHFGWVCFQVPEYVNDVRIRQHELAHINVPCEGHTDKWRAEMVRLGQPIPDRYKRRTRKTTKRS